MHRIAVDRRSGAMELAIEVAKAFEFLSRHRDGATEREVFRAARLFSKAQPSMVPIHNTAELCAGMITGGAGAAENIRMLIEFLEDSRRRVAENAQSLIPEGSDIITMSRSSTIIEAFNLAGEAKRIGTLYITESRPRSEGVLTARALMERGIKCVLVVDALGPSLSRNIDIAVVGADAVLKDGAVVNKVGTYPLALACKEADKPFFVLAESIKLDRRFDSSTWPGPEEMDEMEVLPRPPRGMRALNVYFDLTRSGLVKGVVHDGGVSKRNWATAMEKMLRDGIHLRA